MLLERTYLNCSNDKLQKQAIEHLKKAFYETISDY